MAEREVYVTGTGQELSGVHSPDRCAGEHCAIHNPSDHVMRDFPTHWRDDRKMMERICPHGVGHPDPDEINPDTVHGCDGCCGPLAPARPWTRSVPFQDAKPGDEAHVFDYRPIGDEFGWVTDEDYFDDLDEPVTVTRQRWRLVSEDKVMFHPRTELCPECGGDPDEFGGCGTCDGDGLHPAAGSMELLT